MQKKHILLSICFLAISIFIYYKFDISNDAVTYFGLVVALFTLFFQLIAPISTNTTSTQNSTPAQTYNHTTFTLQKINEIIDKLQNEKYKQALQLTQSIRININTTSNQLHTDRDTSTRIFYLLKKIEELLTNSRNEVRTKRDHIKKNLFDLKEIIERKEIAKNNPLFSSLTILAITTCALLIIISALSMLYFYSIKKSYFSLGLVSSSAVFAYFFISCIGLLYNKQWAKICMKIAFCFFMAVGTLIILMYGTDNSFKY